MDRPAAGTPSPSDAMRPSRRTWWLRTALIVSLGVNLSVAGLVGGAFLRHGGERGGPMGRDLGFGPFTEALSAEDRAALAKAFVAAGGSPREMRRGMRAEFGRLVETMRAQPFDEGELRAAFASLQSHGRERLDLGQRLLADRIVAMQPDARRQFADRLEGLLARGPKRGGDVPPAAD